MPGFKVQFDTLTQIPSIEGGFGVARNTAPATGGSSTAGLALQISSINAPISGTTTAAGLGIFFGSATPTFAAGTGSLFINTTPLTGVLSSSSRLFISTNAQAGWTPVTTSA